MLERIIANQRRRPLIICSRGRRSGLVRANDGSASNGLRGEPQPPTLSHAIVMMMLVENGVVARLATLE